MWHKWFDGHWHEWEDLGGILHSAPGAEAVKGHNHIHTFVCGTDGHPYRKSW